MMIESIRHRRSIRKYLPTPVEEEKLQAVLEAARLAPSGNNKQPWAFIVVKEEAGRVALAEATRKQMWIAEAPIVIVAVADVEARGVDVEGLVLDEHSPLWELKRVIPAIGHKAGDVLDFGGLLGHAPIMPISQYSPAVMIHRGGRIPAPMQALKN